MSDSRPQELFDFENSAYQRNGTSHMPNGAIYQNSVSLEQDSRISEEEMLRQQKEREKALQKQRELEE